MDVFEIVQSLGKELPKKPVFSQNWLDWYRGHVMNFHRYRIYNGDEYRELERKSLNMAKQVCESWANLLMNEKCDIVLPEEQYDKFHNVLNDSNFWVKANGGVELSFALGLGAFVVSVVDLKVGINSGRFIKDKAKVKINFVNEQKIFPITIEDKHIKECAFVSKNSDSTVIVVHVLNDIGNYVIHNYLLDKENKLKEKYTFETGSCIPWFMPIRPNIESNLKTIGWDEQLGISIFANAIDVLKSIDTKYDGFDWEFILGRKRMFISSDAWKVRSIDGELVRAFDPMDTMFYMLPENAEGKQVIENKTDSLRHDSYIQALNADLDYLSMKCGLGETFYRFDGSAIATATQVISDNSTLYRNVKKHELILEDALRKLTQCVIYASNKFTSNPIGEVDDEDIKILFDDSIIEDKGAEMERDRLDVASGIMSKAEYREKWYGETLDEATEKIRDYFLYDVIDRYINALSVGAITPEEYVVKTRGKEDAELAEYIRSYLKQADIEDVSALYAGEE